STTTRPWCPPPPAPSSRRSRPPPRARRRRAPRAPPARPLPPRPPPARARPLPRAEPVPVRAAPRRGTPADLLVVGLGNPGAEYAGTRHNAGADVVALLAARHGQRLRSGREHALAAEARIDGHRVALAFPQT